MDAMKQGVEVECAFLFHVSIRDFRVCVWFGVVTNLAVQILVGTSFMSLFFKDIFPKEARKFLQHSRLGAILMSFKGTLTIQTDATGEPKVNMTTVLRLPRKRQVPPYHKGLSWQIPRVVFSCS